MLHTLKIVNYAIIDEAEIRFSEKLNIITGETGAGKSILLGALSLLLGRRADPKVLFLQHKKCIVEGAFSIGGYGLEEFFETQEIDYDPETLIRREISAGGKSRAFINDTPVTLQMLEQLADRLVTIHSQHETLALGDSRFQLMLVDALAGNAELLAAYKTTYNNWQHCKDLREETEAQVRRAHAEKDFIGYQYAELERAALENSDQEALEQELQSLQHAAEIRHGLMQCTELMENGQVNVADLLRNVQSLLQGASQYQASLAPYAERLGSAMVEIRDIARDLSALAENTQADPRREEEIRQTLDSLYRLEKKHGVGDVEALIALRDVFAAQLGALGSGEEKAAALRREEETLHKKLCEQAEQLSERRTAQLDGLSKSVTKLLHNTGMPAARLQTEHTFDTARLQASGADSLRFLFSANPGSPPLDIRKVASGGELSRLMLCMKSLLAASAALPTLIFDEIDSGISGETANKVGAVLLHLAENHQVIAITHLPQIAAKGDHHLYVFKETTRDSTHTRLRVLDPEERLLEIARMLSGDEPTAAAIENARELIGG